LHPESAPVDFSWRILQRTSIFGAIHAAVALWALMIVSWRGPLVVRGLCLLVGASALAWLIVVSVAGGTNYVAFHLMLLLETAVVAGSLAVFRACGWRLVRHRRA
jgi:hypothetical protein